MKAPKLDKCKDHPSSLPYWILGKGKMAGSILLICPKCDKLVKQVYPFSEMKEVQHG